ncbi:MAG: ribosome recycling factor [Thermoleophilia bacterium]
MNERLKDAKRRMEGAVKAFHNEITSVRTGRASVHLLDRVHVDAYGTKTPLSQLAQIAAPEARLLTIQPYDRSLFGAVEKAIMESDLGLTPSNDGQIIRIAVPQLSEERRKEMVRLVGKMAEEGRVAVRNVRRDVLNEAKRAEKDHELTKDDIGRLQDEVQKLTDAEVKAIDEAMHRKEAEIMEV